MFLSTLVQSATLLLFLATLSFGAHLQKKHLLKAYQKKLSISNRVISDDDYTVINLQSNESQASTEKTMQPPMENLKEGLRKKKLILFGPSSTAEKLNALDEILATTDPDKDILRQRAAIYKKTLLIQQELKRGNSSIDALKKAEKDVRFAQFELKNTWQRLAGASIKPYKSKFFKGIASIAAISSIVKFFYLQNLKEKAKNGSYIPGFKSDVIPNLQYAGGEGAPDSPPPGPAGGSLMFVGIIFAFMLFMCTCGGFCFFYYYLKTYGNDDNPLNKLDLFNVAGGEGGNVESSTGKKTFKSAITKSSPAKSATSAPAGSKSTTTGKKGSRSSSR